MVANCKPYILLALRALLIPVLITLMGKYLEGPPTRVVVHDAFFICACMGVSLYAALYLWQRQIVTLTLAIIQGLVLPLGYITVAQHYYNGAHNNDLRLPMIVGTVLMAGNTLVYLRSLFSTTVIRR